MSSRYSGTRRLRQSAAGSGIALTCSYATMGKNAAIASCGRPETIPAHRSVISSWNSGLRADGRWVVWCCPARAGGTATTSGHAAGVGLEAGVTPVGGAPADGDRADGAAAAADAAACCPCPAPAAWEQPASSPPALISPQAAAIRTAPAGRGPGAVPCLKHFTRSW